MDWFKALNKVKLLVSRTRVSTPWEFTVFCEEKRHHKRNTRLNEGQIRHHEILQNSFCYKHPTDWPIPCLKSTVYATLFCIVTT